MRKYIQLLFLLPAMLSAQERAGEYACRYWFDNNSTQLTEITLPGPNFSFEADANGLSEGLHSLNLMVSDGNGTLSGVKTGFFMRVPTSGVYTVQTLIDGNAHSVEKVSCGSDGLMHLNIDASELANGMHTLSASVISAGGSMSSFSETMFLKAPTSADMQTMKLHYRIDGRDGGILDANAAGGLIHLDLDVSSLSTGLHALNIFMTNGKELHTDIRTTYFLKLPEMGGAIKEYRYWVNNNIDETVTVTLNRSSAKLSIIDMFDVAQTDFTSRSFTCSPERDGSLTLTVNNTLNMLFFGEGSSVVSGSAEFADPRVVRRVDASEINPLQPAYNASMALDRRGDNEIHWFKSDVEPGALFTVATDRACSLEVFSPTGIKVYSASGIESTSAGKIEATEAGTYYLAIHDFAPSVNKVQLNYSLLNRHAVATLTPERTANASTLFVDLYGNGLDELKEVRLRSAEASTTASYVATRDKYNAFARIDLDSIDIPTGVYDLVATYVDSVTNKTENVVLANAITLEEPGVPEIITKIEPSNRAATPYEVYIKVTNNSNVPCAFVPVNLAITESKRGRSIVFKDFYPHRLSTDLTDIMFNSLSHTKNLLGTHVGGFLFPTVIPYIGAHETITLTIGITSDPHELVRMYAWSGEPWSEELKRLTAPDHQYTREDFEQTNILSMTKIVIMQFMSLMKSEGLLPEADSPNRARTGPMKANMSTWGDDAVDAAHSMMNKPNYAGTAKNLAIANGKALGGLYNGLRLNNVNAYMEAFGIDPNDETFGSLSGYASDLKQNMPNPGEVMATAFGHEDDYERAQEYMRHTPECNNPMPDPVDVDCKQANDPNDISGYTSPSGSNHVGLDIKQLGYTIEFENDPETANASAMTIDITNTLDASKFDLASLVPDQLHISNKTVDLPNSHHFVKTVDMRPEINTVAELTFDYEPTDGTIQWHLRALDPMTMDAAEYRSQGILPVNDENHVGEGHVTYTVGLKPGLAHGTEIRNRASIVFDTNAPISTPEWVNITDYERPEAMITATDGHDDSDYEFAIEGSDNGSGLWRYELYGMAPGTSQWRLLADSENAEFSYSPQRSLSGWRFTTLAVDAAGNRQDNTFMSLEFGDVNASGSVDAHDVVLLTGHYVGQPVVIEQRLADINGDSRIDAQDAVMAQSKYVQLSQRNARQRMYPRQK